MFDFNVQEHEDDIHDKKMKIKPFCKIGCDGVVKSKADSGMLQICKLSLALIW